jgi:hypothetical protein
MNEIIEDDPLRDESPAVSLAADCAYTFKRKGEQALRDLLAMMIQPPTELFRAIENDPGLSEQERKMRISQKRDSSFAN